MTETATLSKTSLLGWLLVFIVLLPIGYFGIHVVSSDQAAQGGGVSVDLKDVLVEEVRSAQSKTADEIRSLREDLKAGSAQAGGGTQDTATSQAIAAIEQSLQSLDVEQFSMETKKITDALSVLGQTVEAIREDQLALTRSLGGMPTDPTAQMDPPGTRHDTLNMTVFFPLAASEGAEIDEQIAALLPEMKDYAQGRKCRANIFGFSDTLGNDSSNLRLSKLRAETIAGRLKAEGMTISQVKGWGERWLDVYTKDGVKNERNRRVVIELDCSEPAPTTASVPSS